MLGWIAPLSRSRHAYGIRTMYLGVSGGDPTARGVRAEHRNQVTHLLTQILEGGIESLLPLEMFVHQKIVHVDSLNHAIVQG